MCSVWGCGLGDSSHLGPHSMPSRCTRSRRSRRTSHGSAPCSSRPPTRCGWRLYGQSREIGEWGVGTGAPLPPLSGIYATRARLPGRIDGRPEQRGRASGAAGGYMGGCDQGPLLTVLWCSSRLEGTARSAHLSGSTGSRSWRSSASACTPPSRRSTAQAAPRSAARRHARRAPCRAPCTGCWGSARTCPCTAHSGRCACSNGSRRRRSSVTSRSLASSSCTAARAPGRCTSTARRLYPLCPRTYLPRCTARSCPTSRSNGPGSTGSSSSGRNR